MTAARQSANRSVPPLDYETLSRAAEGRELPLAFVDLDRFDENTRRIAARAGGKPVRIASKSIRCPGLMRRILDHGPPFRGLMTYTAREAAWLAGRGFDDLAVGYPVWDAGEILAACAARRAGADLALMADSPEMLRRLSEFAVREEVILPVMLDLDMSSEFPGLYFGVRRSPVRTPAAAASLARLVLELPGLRLHGLMGYEAQIAGLQDALPGRALMNRFIRALKRRSVPEIHRRRAETVRAIEALGIELRVVNGGGTGSLETTRGDSCVTEVAAGSGFYCPGLFDGFRNFELLPAAGFAHRIVRRPAPGLFTCHGGGYPASGPAGENKLPRPWFPEGANLLPNEGGGEVQTPIRYSGPVPLEAGSPVFFRHAKAGELCEHFDKVLLIREGRAEGEALTYRGEGLRFL